MRLPADAVKGCFNRVKDLVDVGLPRGEGTFSPRLTSLSGLGGKLDMRLRLFFRGGCGKLAMDTDLLGVGSPVSTVVEAMVGTAEVLARCTVREGGRIVP